MNTTTRRTLCSAAATGVLAVASALPAAAKVEEFTEPRTAPGGAETVIVEVDDNALEFGQVGLGVLAGATAAGAAALALRRREHGVPHPA